MKYLVCLDSFIFHSEGFFGTIEDTRLFATDPKSPKVRCLIWYGIKCQDTTTKKHDVNEPFHGDCANRVIAWRQVQYEESVTEIVVCVIPLSFEQTWARCCSHVNATLIHHQDGRITLRRV